MERSGHLADTLLIVPGFGQSALTREKNGEKEYLWPPAITPADVMDAMKGPFIKLLFTRKDMGFSDGAVRLFHKYASPLSRNENGGPLREAPDEIYEKEAALPLLGKDFPLEELKAIYGENLRVVPLDFFRSPVVNADAFVYYMKENGIEKADILSLNFGSATLLSVLYRHPEKADRAVFVSPRFEGLDLAADVYEDKLTGVRVRALMQEMSGKTVESFREILKMLPPEILDNIVKKIRDDAVKTVLRNSPGAWAAVPSARLSAALAAVFGEERPTVRDMAEFYDEIRSQRGNLLAGAAVIEGDLVHPFPRATQAVLAALSR